jgi:hypothetical protein
MDAAKALVAEELARPAIVPADDRNVSQDVVASK